MYVVGQSPLQQQQQQQHRTAPHVCPHRQAGWLSGRRLPAVSMYYAVGILLLLTHIHFITLRKALAWAVCLCAGVLQRRRPSTRWLCCRLAHATSICTCTTDSRAWQQCRVLRCLSACCSQVHQADGRGCMSLCGRRPLSFHRRTSSLLQVLVLVRVCV